MGCSRLDYPGPTFPGDPGGPRGPARVFTSPGPSPRGPQGLRRDTGALEAQRDYYNRLPYTQVYYPAGEKELSQPFLRVATTQMFENGIEPLTLRFSVLCSTTELFKLILG